jgi:hypothetical protein
MSEDTISAVTSVITIFVICPIAIAFARLIWKRASEPSRPRQVESDQLYRRLDDLQHTVEAMAIEVERISEGQRFVTKLMSEKERQPLGAGASTRNT